MVPALLPALFSVVFLCLLVYKMWSALQDGTPRTSPGEAVAFLFVPVFNLYWIFQAYWAWTKEHNRFVAARGLLVPRVSASLALAVCILTLCGAIPILGVFLALVNCVLLLVFFNNAIDGVNALAEVQEAA
jgi:hypothetical protein